MFNGEGSKQAKRDLLVGMKGLVQFESYPIIGQQWTQHQFVCVDVYKNVGARLDSACAMGPEIKYRASTAASVIAPIRRGVLSKP
eukprot:3064936-Karenia_brevis.AAC.1